MYNICDATSRSVGGTPRTGMVTWESRQSGATLTGQHNMYNMYYMYNMYNMHNMYYMYNVCQCQFSCRFHDFVRSSFRFSLRCSERNRVHSYYSTAAVRHVCLH